MRRFLPYIFVSIIALGVAAGAWVYLQQYQALNKEMVSLPVPVRDIEPYTTITANDIIMKSFLKGAEESTAATEVSEVVGRLATGKLNRGWQIDKRSLASKEFIGDQQVVGVNVDVARAGDVKVGDVVDVYWLTPDQGNWSPAGASHVIAQNARVIRIVDDRGVSTNEAGSIAQGTIASVSAIKGPSVVYLMIEPKDVSKVISGAAPKNTSIALAKKTKPTKTKEVIQHAEGVEEE
ncbi:MAG: hypothetical protein C4575_01945 [Desulforudis sp.]|nr:MAG: hypothetical protein C4575_01945 [Desulforudis sp.]